MAGPACQAPWLLLAAPASFFFAKAWSRAAFTFCRMASERLGWGLLPPSTPGRLGARAPGDPSKDGRLDRARRSLTREGQEVAHGDAVD